MRDGRSAHIRHRAACRPNRWAVLALLGTAQLMVVLDATIVNIALPSAQQALHFSTADREWIVTAYALAFGSLLLLGGKLGDLFGRKWTFIAGLSGFAIVSAIGGQAQSFDMLVASRALQGMFGALLAPSALGTADGHVRGLAGPGEGVRDLRRDRRRRRVDRSPARRGAHADPVLALVLVRQPGDRDADGDLRAAPAGQPQRPRADGHRRPRPPDRLRRGVRARLRLLQRRDPILDGPGHDHRARRQPGAADHLRGHREPRQEPTAAAAHRARPRSRGRVPLGPSRLCRHLRRVLLSHVLHAADPPLLAVDHRRGLPADDRASWLPPRSRCRPGCCLAPAPSRS